MMTRPCSLLRSGNVVESVSMPAVVLLGSLRRMGVSEPTSSSQAAWPSSWAASALSMATTRALLANGATCSASSLAAWLTRSTQSGESGIQASGRSGCSSPRPSMASTGLRANAS